MSDGGNYIDIREYYSDKRMATYRAYLNNYICFKEFLRNYLGFCIVFLWVKDSAYNKHVRKCA